MGGAKDTPLKGGDNRGVTEQATSANSSFMHDTSGESQANSITGGSKARGRKSCHLFRSDADYG